MVLVGPILLLTVRCREGAQASRRIRTHVLLAVPAALKSDHMLGDGLDLLRARVDLQRLRRLLRCAVRHLHHLFRYIIRTILHFLFDLALRGLVRLGFGCGFVFL